MKQYSAQFNDQLWQSMVNMIAYNARPENAHRQDRPKTMREFVALMCSQGVVYFQEKDMGEGVSYPLGKLPRGRPKRTL